jgi:hypothetical protein
MSKKDKEKKGKKRKRKRNRESEKREINLPFLPFRLSFPSLPLFCYFFFSLSLFRCMYLPVGKDVAEGVDAVKADLQVQAHHCQRDRKVALVCHHLPGRHSEPLQCVPREQGSASAAVKTTPVREHALPRHDDGVVERQGCVGRKAPGAAEIHHERGVGRQRRQPRHWLRAWAHRPNVPEGKERNRAKQAVGNTIFLLLICIFNFFIIFWR